MKISNQITGKTMSKTSNNHQPQDGGSALRFLANELAMPEECLRADAMELLYMKIGFRPGDMVRINPESQYCYEVAKIERFSHGWMVGIYDEPPSKHVDFWTPCNLYHI